MSRGWENKRFSFLLGKWGGDREEGNDSKGNTMDAGSSGTKAWGSKASELQRCVGEKIEKKPIAIKSASRAGATNNGPRKKEGWGLAGPALGPSTPKGVAEA